MSRVEGPETDVVEPVRPAVQKAPYKESTSERGPNQVQVDEVNKALSHANIAATFYRELTSEGVPFEVARDLTIAYITTNLRRDFNVLQ